MKKTLLIILLAITVHSNAHAGILQGIFSGVSSAGNPPSAPVSSSATGSNLFNTLHPGTSAGATSYNAYWTNDGTTPTVSSSKITGVADGQTHTSLSAAIYKYGFTAVGAGGESSLSSVSTVTTYYAANFDSESTGAIAAGWANKAGTYTVQANHPVSGANAFGSSSHADGDVALYTNMVALRDMTLDGSSVMMNTVCGTSGGTVTGVLDGPIFRMNSGYTDGYVILFQVTAGQIQVSFYKRVSSSYTQIGSNSSNLLAVVAGDIFHWEISASGNNFSAYVWKNSGSKPGTASWTATDSTFSSSTGLAGFYNGLAGTSCNPAVDDVTVTPN